MSDGLTVLFWFLPIAIAIGLPFFLYLENILRFMFKKRYNTKLGLQRAWIL